MSIFWDTILYSVLDKYEKYLWFSKVGGNGDKLSLTLEAEDDLEFGLESDLKMDWRFLRASKLCLLATPASPEAAEAGVTSMEGTG